MTLEQATSIYLDIHHQPTGDLRTDLLVSGRIAFKWRTVGPEATATIVHALHRHLGMSQREIAREFRTRQSTIKDMIDRVEAGHWDRSQ